MKLIGLIGIIITTTSIGIYYSNNIKSQIIICESLSLLCDDLINDISFKKTPIIQLLDTKLKLEKYSNLSFISHKNIKEKRQVKSCLSSDENERLSLFLYSLGKSSPSALIAEINTFKFYIEESKNKYYETYKKNSRLYIMLGFFSGVIIALVIA